MKHRSVDEQLSLSDLVEKVFVAYLSKTGESTSTVEQLQLVQEKATVSLQPMLHVDDMGKALDFYSSLVQRFLMVVVMEIGPYYALALAN